MVKTSYFRKECKGYYFFFLKSFLLKYTLFYFYLLLSFIYFYFFYFPSSHSRFVSVKIDEKKRSSGSGWYNCTMRTRNKKVLRELYQKFHSPFGIEIYVLAYIRVGAGLASRRQFYSERTSAPVRNWPETNTTWYSHFFL